MKSYYSQENGWNWRISFCSRLARLRRPKILCFPSYVGFRSRGNVTILLELSNTLRREHIWEVWVYVGNPKLESV
jgi:hypothetical protein